MVSGGILGGESSPVRAGLLRHAESSLETGTSANEKKKPRACELYYAILIQCKEQTQ